MLNRKLSPEGDYTFGHGLADFYKDAEAIGQAVKTRLLLLYGEWWEDRENGTPLFEVILQKSMSEDSIKAVDLIIKDRILSVDGVNAISHYESIADRRSRSYRVNANIETVYGETNVDFDFGG